MRLASIIFTLTFTLLVLPVVVPVANAEVNFIEETVINTVVHDPILIEKQVREHFADIPVMVAIARCESNFRQFTDDGNVLRGSGGTIGIFQFNEAIHSAVAMTLGYNLETVQGNLDYARHLYRQAGLQPWSSCVPKGHIESSQDEITQLKIQLMTQLILLLRQLLELKLEAM